MAGGRPLARTLALMTACAVMLGAGTAAADAAIRVTTTEGQELVRFTKLSCRTDSAGFHGRAIVKKWRLVVRIQPFRGFRTYELDYGDDGNAFFFLDPPGGGGTYSNAQVPPTDIPRLTLGGAIHFPNGRKQIRLAFPIAYDESSLSPNIVRVVGTAKCAFKGRR